MFRSLLAGAALFGLAAALPAPTLAGSGVVHVQQSMEEKADEAEKAFKDAADKLMTALRAMLRAIPQYEMPEITEEGDIIIRRKRMDEEPPDHPEPPPKDDNTSST
jgi:hypothetical protein